jgi:hypothetical protein
VAVVAEILETENANAVLPVVKLKYSHSLHLWDEREGEARKRVNFIYLD